ncbi:hypothetical protein [Enterococcus sp. AZ196]|uniref:hypothetical protein n=1 Tax=Enterococcus sp. AZ196 TaxID=2774659 RepID=UPI003D2DC229
MRVIILTNNVLVEEETQLMLQFLGHEVFITSKQLQYYLDFESNQSIEIFDVCIISRTVSNREAERVAIKFSQSKCSVLREVEEINNDVDSSTNLPYRQMKTKQTITELREALVATA